mgnify:FL=1
MTQYAEESLIARLLVEPGQIPLFADQLTTGDFGVRLCGEAWAAMIKLASAGTRIDIVTLRAEGVVLDDPLAGLSSGHTAPLAEYVRLIKNSSFRRHAGERLRRMAAEVEAGVNRDASISVIHQGMTEILDSTADAGNLISLQSAIDAFVPDEGGLLWGFVPLDRVIQPLRGGQMVVIAARPSIGKTTIAEHMALTWAYGASTPVLFVSIEMAVGQLLSRALSRHGDLSSLRTGYNLYYLDEPRATTAIIRAQAARLRMRYGGLRAIVIDYIQILADAGRESQQVRVSDISRECKAIAREFQCPVLAVSQLNRQSEGREDRKPRLADLRDSGAIEQDADIVLGLFRPFLSATDLTISVLKNRHGPSGAEIPMYFDLERVSIGGA